MKNEIEGSVLLVMSNKTKSPHHAMLTGGLARTSKVQGRRGKGEREKYSWDSARHHIRDGVERIGTVLQGNQTRTR